MATLADLLSQARTAAGLETPGATRAPRTERPSQGTGERRDRQSGPLDALLGPFRGLTEDPLLWIAQRAAQTLRDRGEPPMGGVPSVGSAPAPPSGSAPGNLVTRRGATLTPAAMQALLQAAREYKAVRGTRELGLFGPLATYRTYAEQAALGGTAQNPGGSNPNATTAGSSFHEKGLAIDLPAALQTPKFEALLRSLGWNQLPSEKWHWSFGVTG